MEQRRRSYWKAVTGLFDTFNGFVKKTDFAALGKGIVSSIGGFFKNLSWSSIGTALSNAIKALADFLYGVVSGTDWAAVPQYIVDAIKDFFTSFDWSGVSKSLGKLLGSAVKGAIDLVGSIWDMLKKPGVTCQIISTITLRTQAGTLSPDYGTESPMH